MKQVLVTGGTGFIGRHTIPALVARGFAVHLAIPPAERVEFPSGLPVQAHPCNLLEPAEVTQLIAEVRPSHLLHLAWYVEHGKFWTAPANVPWVEASLALLRRFTEAGGSRAVIAGSCAEYARSEVACRELSTPAEPRTLYGICKDALRRVAQGYAAQTGLSLAWGRIFLLYGPGENPQRLVPALIVPLLAGQQARCNFGAHVRDFLHVADVGAAFAALLDRDVRGPVNIASGRPVTLQDVAQLIAEVTAGPGELQVQCLAPTEDNPPVITADTARLTSEVGWQAQYDLRTGLAQTVDWWKGQPKT